MQIPGHIDPIVTPRADGRIDLMGLVSAISKSVSYLKNRSWMKKLQNCAQSRCSIGSTIAASLILRR